MFRSTASGCRRASGVVRRLPDRLPRAGASWAVKSLAAATVLSGAAIALALPVDASPTAPLALSAGPGHALTARSSEQSASRSAVRAQRPAVTAPAVAAPAAPEKVGVSGVKPVAKPKPKPKPKPVVVSNGSSSGSSNSSSSGSSKSNGSSSSSEPRGSYGTGKCGGIGLTSRAAQACSAVQSVFGLGTIGGYRANAGEHSTGQAIDFMISSRSQGDSIAAYVQSHSGSLNVKYVIWRQRYWEPGSSWRGMEDRGSPTANHMDHVHVTVN